MTPPKSRRPSTWRTALSTVRSTASAGGQDSAGGGAAERVGLAQLIERERIKDPQREQMTLTQPAARPRGGACSRRRPYVDVHIETVGARGLRLASARLRCTAHFRRPARPTASPGASPRATVRRRSLWRTCSPTRSAAARRGSRGATPRRTGCRRPPRSSPRRSGSRARCCGATRRCPAGVSVTIGASASKAESFEPLSVCHFCNSGMLSKASPVAGFPEKVCGRPR